MGQVIDLDVRQVVLMYVDTYKKLYTKQKGVVVVFCCSTGCDRPSQTSQSVGATKMFTLATEGGRPARVVNLQGWQVPNATLGTWFFDP